MGLSARAARRTACRARGRGVDWLAVIEITTLLIGSDVDTIEPRAKAPHPASGGRPILATFSPAAAKTPARRAIRDGTGQDGVHGQGAGWTAISRATSGVGDRWCPGPLERLP